MAHEASKTVPAKATTPATPVPAASISGVLSLPLIVAGPVDLGRLIRELDAVDNSLNQSELRQDSDIKLPKTSRMMDQAISLNKINMLLPSDRKRLGQFLAQVRDAAPVLHISFSTDPSPLFVEKLMTWLRREIDPLLLLTVGLQPNIGAGCVVRTTNKYFDMSLRKRFTAKRELLMAELTKVVT